MKFYEAAKYYYFPGMHEPAAMLACGTNKQWFDSLSKSDQLLIESAASMENDVMMAEYNAKNGSSLATLIADQGSSCASLTMTSTMRLVKPPLRCTRMWLSSAHR